MVIYWLLFISIFVSVLLFDVWLEIRKKAENNYELFHDKKLEFKDKKASNLIDAFSLL